MRLDEPAADSFTLVGAACDLLREMWSGERINFLAVTLSEFSEPTNQMQLPVGAPTECRTSYLAPRTSSDQVPSTKYEVRRATDRKRLASDAADLIRDRYGDEAIMFGSMLGADDHAPDRIGFRKVGDLELTHLP